MAFIYNQSQPSALSSGAPLSSNLTDNSESVGYNANDPMAQINASMDFASSSIASSSTNALSSIEQAGDEWNPAQTSSFQSALENWYDPSNPVIKNAAYQANLDTGARGFGNSNEIGRAHV